MRMFCFSVHEAMAYVTLPDCQPFSLHSHCLPEVLLLAKIWCKESAHISGDPTRGGKSVQRHALSSRNSSASVRRRLEQLGSRKETKVAFPSTSIWCHQ